ncbi:glycoside hydrolase family 79 protein [Athelia psychrophila]|uniref:Glycoside hydrolase family 79 protein n=1 Tax=Athelia psychrophila TaxID=1759441 RepID=A0A166VX82_9AGAM|nr:glycoside hydrolase family 79 protein [Fibularhizoctonia sp. CBS 109695]
MRFILTLAFCFSSLSVAHASVTVYNQVPIGQATGTAQSAAAAYSGSAAYDSTVLNAPPIPNPAPPNQFTLQLQSSSNAVQGLSIMQSGSFLGFSIETSVVNQILGINSSFLQVPFLNLMANIKQRAGSVHVRVGGNTQETATLVDSIPDGKAIEKDKGLATNPTQTPALIFTREILYMLANITSLAGVQWYLGVPFNDTSNLRLGIAEAGQAILGDNLIGLQCGNEPDLYASHNNRPATYSPYDYFGEFGVLVQAINNNQNIPVKNKLIGPSVASGDWTPEMVWDTGFIPAYSNSLSALAVEHYPDNNCGAAFQLGAIKDPQTQFPNYLNHTAGKLLIAPYLNSTAIAQAAGKPFLMFETNTASCGGFPGISNAFGSALWGLDYGLQMAHSNFSGALFHVGGQSVYYNPFTAPPTNQSAFHQWTIGPLYYSTLVSAEVFGPSNTAQIIDLNANDDNMFTPAYALYEGGNLARVALFNYMTDPSGANTYTATISIPSGAPSQVKVKYLQAASVAQRTNITWAGQTFGGNFESDGRLQGSLDVQTVACDTTANTCQIKVPAPSFALVFLNDDVLSEVTPQNPLTFATTAVTKKVNTATVDAAVLATSNGHSGLEGGPRMGTSKTTAASNAAGSVGNARPAMNALVVMAMTLGALMVGTQR